jgi:hypothetical protein
MSKNRRGRNKGVNRSKLRYYNSEIIQVGRNPNPLVLRQYKKRMDSVRQNISEPYRTQIQPDYSTEWTPRETKPKAEVKNKLRMVRIDRDFYDGLDQYHRIYMKDNSTDTLKIYLFFHAQHCYFIMNDLVKKQAFMSHDFNDRNRALTCLRTGKLRWVQEVQIE